MNGPPAASLPQPRPAPLFRRVLIANRGEVAVRIARTCDLLGATPVLAVSTADQGAAYTEGRETICVGASRPAASYLQANALVQAALQTRCTAVHPGWGFLSENPEWNIRIDATPDFTAFEMEAVDFDLRYGELREEVEKFAKSKDADLVAMISHKRNFLSRVLDINPIEGIAKEIDIPLLVIKNDAYQIDQKGWEWVELARSFA